MTEATKRGRKGAASRKGVMMVTRSRRCSEFTLGTMGKGEQDIITIAQTFRVTDYERMQETIKSKESIEDSQQTYLVHRSELDILRGRNICDDNAYICWYGRPDEESRVPYLGEILDISAISCHGWLIYINADIEVSQNDGIRLREWVNRGRGDIVLMSRCDYEDNKAEAVRYVEGFDVLGFSREWRERADEGMRGLKIGNVGWDYMVPMATRMERVCAVKGDVWHRRHKSGSRDSWEEMILRVVKEMHETWIDEVGTLGRLTQQLIRLYWVRCRKRYRGRRLIAGCDYMLSRMSYYLLVKRVLIKIERRALDG